MAAGPDHRSGRPTGRVIKRTSLDAVVLDTTVQPKAIAHPTDSRLLEPRARATGRRGAGRAASRCARATRGWARRPSTRPGATPTPSSTGACAARSRGCAPGWAASSRGRATQGWRDHRARSSTKVEIAQRLHAATPRLEEQAVRAARPGGGVHRQGQGQQRPTSSA